MSASMIDTIKALFTYSTASVLALGGVVAIVYTQGNPTAADTRVVIAGFVGLALQFLFGQEIATRAARQSAAVTLAAVNSNGNGHGTP